MRRDELLQRSKRGGGIVDNKSTIAENFVLLSLSSGLKCLNRRRKLLKIDKQSYRLSLQHDLALPPFVGKVNRQNNGFNPHIF